MKLGGVLEGDEEVGKSRGGFSQDILCTQLKPSKNVQLRYLKKSNDILKLMSTIPLYHQRFHPKIN